MNLSTINTSILPVIKTEWQSQLDALRTANEAARKKVNILTQDVLKDSTLQPQLDQARLEQFEAARQYNSFIESGSLLLKVAQDADARLQKTNLTLLERQQLEAARSHSSAAGMDDVWSSCDHADNSANACTWRQAA